LQGRCDSFVVETNVHYPTDINLLLDALRKIILLTARLSKKYRLTDWRQHLHNFRSLKRLMRTVLNKKRGACRSEEKKKQKEKEIQEAYLQYIQAAQGFVKKAQATLAAIGDDGDIVIAAMKQTIEKFIVAAYRQIDQIKRRVILGEMIPHDEKVFSIFEPHTEWVVKGKAGVPVELGLKVCILEDQHQFILSQHVMEKQTDEQIALFMTKEGKSRFPSLCQVSYDKGFHSPTNQEELKKEIATPILPRKGKLSKKVQELEHSKAFIKARHQHSAVESAINALEVHGLDYCPDHGIYGFKRYVALAVVANNVARIGAIIKAQREKALKKKYKKYGIREPLKMAA